MIKKNLNFFKDKTSEEIITPLLKNPGNAVVNTSKEKFENELVIAIKDIHAQIDNETTSASNVLNNFIAGYDSTVVSLLKENDYKIICHTNMDEFAMGGQSVGSCYGEIDSALNSNNLAGGSSGGSAYLVGKGLVPIATGTDTGGSVRQPAALNGIYGFKPTYGLISRYGTYSFASSFDTVGLLANDIDDINQVFNVLVAADEKDQTQFLPKKFSKVDKLEINNDHKKIAFIQEWEEIEINPELRKSLNGLKNSFIDKGYEVDYVSIPEVKYSFELYTTLAFSEASSNLSRYDGIRFGNRDGNVEYLNSRNLFGKEVKKRLLIGSYMLASDNSKKYYEHAQKIRTKMLMEFKEVFEKFDYIVGPMVVYGYISKTENHFNYESNLEDIFAIPANLTGIPSISVPLSCNDSYPCSAQILSNHHHDIDLLEFAKEIGEDINE